MLEMIRQMALDSGMYQAGYLDASQIRCYPEVRKTCEGNACGNYDKTWTCPPGVGTLEECRERLMAFDKMLLFSKKYELEDEFDFEGMGGGLLDFKKTVAVFDSKIRPVLKEFILLSNEGCGRCAKCTYPDEPCRFPELVHHSISSYGLYVAELAKAAGVNYNNGKATVTYLGALMVKE